MIIFWMVQAALIIPLCASTVDVSTIKVSCSDIQTQHGFQFKYDRPAGTEFWVHHGETLIDSLEIGKQPNLSSEVIQLDNKSVITKQCRDLLIKVFTVKDQNVGEEWLSFKVTANSDNPVTPSSQVNNTQFIQENTTEPVLPTPESHTAISSWIAYLIGALIVVSVIIIGVFLYFYLSWKKKMSFLWPCNALKKCISTKAESSETQETRPLSGIEMQILDTVNQQNGNSLENIPATEPSATEPSGSGEDGVAQDSPHGSVHVVSIHPQCNGLDHKLGNEEFEPTANGDLNIPDVDRASPHGDMNSVRNMRDDPGGSNGDDYVSVDIPDPDMTAEAKSLVNKSGYDQEHVSRCSATPEPDVESKPRVKNFGIY